MKRERGSSDARKAGAEREIRIEDRRAYMAERDRLREGGQSPGTGRVRAIIDPASEDDA